MSKKHDRQVFFSRQQAQAIDRIAIQDFGFESLVLMESASIAAANLWLSLADAHKDSVLIFCGTGNNGGDGMAMARHLYIAGVRVGVVLVGDPKRLTDDCDANWKILSQTKIFTFVLPLHLDDGRVDQTIEQLLTSFQNQVLNSTETRTSETSEGPSQKLTWVVDALVGTGAIGALRAPLAQVVNSLNLLPAERFAIDLPSGWDCDQGPTDGAIFNADVTCTFVAMKKSFANVEGINDPKKSLLGQIFVRQIGVPPEVVARVLEKQG